MQRDGKLEICPFRGPLFTNKNATMEQLLKINNKHGYISKCFLNGANTSVSDQPKATLQYHQPKLNAVHFNYIYDSINTRDNTNAFNPLVNTTDKHIPKEEDIEEEEYFGYEHETGTTKETLDNKNPDKNHNFPYPTMNSGVMDM